MSTMRLLEFPGPLPAAPPPNIYTPPVSDILIDTRPAMWVLANVHYRRPWEPARLLNILAESAYLLACVEHRPGHDLAWAPFGMASPPHLSRFLSESLGMAVCLEVANERYGWRPWRDPMVNVDEIDDPAMRAVLTPPPSVAPTPVPIVTTRGTSWHAPARTARPDFVFLIPGLGVVAAEARGRSGIAGRYPTGPQQRRCADMAEWSQRTGGLQWFISWTEASDQGSQVTVFDPGEPLELTRSVLQMGERVEKARYDRMFISGSEDEQPVYRAGDVTFHVASQALPATSSGRPEWLTLAVADRSLPGATVFDQPTPSWRWGFESAISLMSFALTPRLVSILTDEPPTLETIEPLLRAAAIPD